MTVQSAHDELEAKFFEERAALEAKYQNLYQPLYAKVSRGFSLLIFQLFMFKAIEFNLYSCLKLLGLICMVTFNVISSSLNLFIDECSAMKL